MIPQDSWPRLQDGVVGEEVVMVLVVVMEEEAGGAKSVFWRRGSARQETLIL